MRFPELPFDVAREMRARVERIKGPICRDWQRLRAHVKPGVGRRQSALHGGMGLVVEAACCRVDLGITRCKACLLPFVNIETQRTVTATPIC